MCRKRQKSPTAETVGDSGLDINMDGQILPLVAAEVLTMGLFILQRLIETDGKLEILSVNEPKYPLKNKSAQRPPGGMPPVFSKKFSCTRRV